MTEPCFTLKDVAEHNGLGNSKTWVVIKNIVYDVTDYLEKHPGGGDLLLEYAGKDGTAAFDDFGHSSDAKTLIKTYRIGRLVEEDGAANGQTGSNKLKNTKFQNDDIRKNKRSLLRVVCGGCV